MYMSAIPAAVTSHLKQRLINTCMGKHITKRHRRSIRQWRKRLRASMRQKDITLNICYSLKPAVFRAIATHDTIGSLPSHQQSTEEIHFYLLYLFLNGCDGNDVFS